METETITNLIGTLGFPIFCCVCLGFFIYKFYKDYTADAKANMEAVQARCKEREEKLFEEIKLNREVNAKAINTIALYSERLENIQQDVSDIKKDMATVLAKTD